MKMKGEFDLTSKVTWGLILYTPSFCKVVLVGLLIGRLVVQSYVGLCIASFNKTFYSEFSLFTHYYKWVPATLYNAKGNPALQIWEGEVILPVASYST